MKNKFFILIILLFFVSSCSISNPLKKEANVTYLDCPKSLILLPASKIIINNLTIELPNEYQLNCYQINKSEIVEISIDYKLILKLSEEEIKEHQILFLAFITNKNEDKKLEELRVEKNLGLNKSNKNTFEYNFNDKIQIAIEDYEKGIKLFIGISEY